MLLRRTLRSTTAIVNRNCKYEGKYLRYCTTFSSNNDVSKTNLQLDKNPHNLLKDHEEKMNITFNDRFNYRFNGFEKKMENKTERFEKIVLDILKANKDDAMRTNERIEKTLFEISKTNQATKTVAEKLENTLDALNMSRKEAVSSQIKTPDKLWIAYLLPLLPFAPGAIGVGIAILVVTLVLAAYFMFGLVGLCVSSLIALIGFVMQIMGE